MKNVFKILLFLLITLSCSHINTLASIYKYDSLNRVIEICGDNGIKQDYSYDKAGNILSITTHQVESIYLIKQNIYMVKNDKWQIKLTALFDDGQEVDVTSEVDFIIADGSIVQVDNGEITASDMGNTTITFNYGGKTAILGIRVFNDILNKSIGEAIDTIERLPDPKNVAIEDKTMIEEARSLVNTALSNGATLSDITNIDKLVACEAALNNPLKGTIYGKITTPSHTAGIFDNCDGVIVAVKGTSITTASAIDGTYTLENVPPGTITITFKKDKYAEAIINDLLISADVNTRADEILLLLGDVNGDGSVSQKDYDLVKQYILCKITSYPLVGGLSAADVDRDGKITSRDYALIKEILDKK